jgi:hypothetical protein
MPAPSKFISDALTLWFRIRNRVRFHFEKWLRIGHHLTSALCPVRAGHGNYFTRRIAQLDVRDTKCDLG